MMSIFGNQVNLYLADKAIENFETGTRSAVNKMPFFFVDCKKIDFAAPDLYDMLGPDIAPAQARRLCLCRDTIPFN